MLDGLLDLLVAGNVAFELGEMADVPILGQIACGTPDFFEQEDLGFAHIPVEWITDGCYLLRAVGDSMVDAGIADHSLVLIERTQTAMFSDIVVAMTEEGNTLKRYSFDPERGRPCLRAENETYPIERRVLYPKSIEIQGKLSRVLTRYQAQRAVSYGVEERVVVAKCPNCNYRVLDTPDPGKIKLIEIRPAGEKEATPAYTCPACNGRYIVHYEMKSGTQLGAVKYKQMK